MKYIILILLLLVTVPTCSAGTGGLSPVSVGSDMIASGIDKAIVNIADSLIRFISGDAMENTTGNTTIEEEAHLPTVTKMIIGFATWNPDPFKYPIVITMMGTSLCCAVVYMVIYAFAGAAAAAMGGSTGQGNLQYLLDIKSSSSPFRNYAKNIIVGCVMISFMVLGIFVTLLLSKVLKMMIMASIANAISPSMESVSILYLAMVIMWVFVSIFFAISNIVICLTAAFSFLLGALYASDKTRHITKWWMNYFYSMVIMQVFVIAVTAVVVGMIMDIKRSATGWMLTPGMESTMYVGLILFLLWGCSKFVFGKTNVIGSATKVIKLVV